MNEHCILAPPFLSDSQRVTSQVEGLGNAVREPLRDSLGDSPLRQYVDDL